MGFIGFCRRSFKNSVLLTAPFLLLPLAVLSQTEDPPPTCTLSVTPSTVYAPFASVFANGNCTDAQNAFASTSLDFGDGTILQNTTSGSHTYANKPATYTVTVSATDLSGQTNPPTTQQVIVKAVPSGQAGDVYVSVDQEIDRYDSQGSREQSLRRPKTFEVFHGMAFDSKGNLYAADNASAPGTIDVFSPDGTFLNTFGSGYSNPSSLVFDKAGNLYVGEFGDQIAKLDSSGNLVTNFNVAVENSGTTKWIDLAPDQCTLYYTSQGISIKRYNVCATPGTPGQLPNFVSELPGSQAEGLRIRPNGEVLVAVTSEVVRLDAAGHVLGTYNDSNSNCNVNSHAWTGISLDPDGKTFWATDVCTSSVYRFDITTGEILTAFNILTCDCSISGAIEVRQQAVVAPNQPPSCTLSGVPPSGTAPLSVTATASCSDAEDDITKINIGWDKGTSDQTSVTPGTHNPTFTATHVYSSAGTFNVAATATDIAGQSSDPATASQQVVVSSNQPPTCTFSASPTTGNAPLTVNGNASCSDPENDISSASIDWNDGTARDSLVCDGDCFFRGPHQYPKAGTYNASVTANDTAGNSTTTTPVKIIVAPAQAPPPTNGDVYVSVSDGKIQRHASDGTLLQILDTGTNHFTDGMAFDKTGNLYVTDGSAPDVFRFDPNGALLGQFGSGFSADTESIVFDSAGNSYVGEQDGNHQVVKLDPQGNVLAHFSPAIEDRGTDWIELASDQCTLFYTSEGTSIKRFNVCGTPQQLTDFKTRLPGNAFALRLRPNGELLVADSAQVLRFAPDGTLLTTYTAPNQNCFFALNLDPDGTSVWSADYCTSSVYKFDIASGTPLLSFNTGSPTNTVFGITIRGEITTGAQAQKPTCKITLDHPNGGQAPLTVTADGACTETTNNGGFGTVTMDFGDPNNPQQISNTGNGSQSLTVHGVHQYASPGNYTITLDGKDNAGLSGTDKATFTVSQSVDSRPQCTLTANPAAGQVPFTVIFSGTCTDAGNDLGEGGTATLNFGDGTPPQQISVINGGNFSNVSHTYQSAGSPITATYTVTDARGNTGVATAIINATSPPPPNLPPTCTLTATAGTGLTSLTVSASGNCTDPEKDIVSTSLDFGDGTVQAGTSGDHTYSKPGTYTITVTATDQGGLKGSASQTVTLSAVNTAPTCTLTVSPTTGVVPLAVVATGNCTDAENNITTTVLDFGDGPMTSGSSGSHTYNRADVYTVKLTATDAGGLTGSATQVVTATLPAFPIGVFVGLSPGSLNRYGSDGTLLKAVSTGLGGTVAGMAFDKAGNIYAADFTAGNISKFDNSGNLLGTFGSGYNCQPESLVFDGAGNLYVGQQGCSRNILKFDSSGKLLDQFTVTAEEQGSDDIDLSADQCTMLYTSEGPSILRYDVCKKQQLTPFATGLKKALVPRILPDGGVIVTDLVDILRLDSTGKTITTYTAPGEQCWYPLTLDQDGTSFWAADYCSSNIYQFDIASGKQLGKFNSGTASGTIFGIARAGTGLNVAGMGSGGTMTASPATATLAAGQSATFTVTFSVNQSAVGQTFQLSCAGLPVGFNCGFSPPSITPTSTAAVTAQMTITSPATRASLHQAITPWAFASWLALFPAVVFGMLPGSSRKNRKRGSLLVLMFVALAAFTSISCGGSNHMTNTVTAAPQGSYNVIVVGHSAQSQASTTVNVTVQ